MNVVWVVVVVVVVKEESMEGGSGGADGCRGPCSRGRGKFRNTVELVHSGHPSEAAKWLLYTGGLLIEVFNVYVVYGKFHWDFPY